MTENTTVGNFGVFAFPNTQVGTANRGFDDFHHCVGRIDNLRTGFFFKTDIVCAVINHCFHADTPCLLINNFNTAIKSLYMSYIPLQKISQ